MTTAWSLTRVDGRSWWPSAQLRPAPTWFGRQDLRRTRLGDLARVLALSSPCEDGLPLVRPEDVDEYTGQILPTSITDASEGLRLGDDLRAGDVLVPKRGAKPAVLVTQELDGVVFDASFVVVRVRANVDVVPHLLWALLSSRTGLNARADASAGTARPQLTTNALAELVLPVPLPTFGEAVRTQVPRPAIPTAVLDGLRSRWGSIDLRGESAWARRLEHVSQANDGIELKDIGRIWTGRVEPGASFGAPAQDRLPLVQSADVRGKPSPLALFATSAGDTVTTESTVVLTATEPFRALLAPAGRLLTKHLIGIDVADVAGLSARAVAGGLATLLSTFEGRRQLDLHASGSALRRLTAAAVGRVCVRPTEIVQIEGSSEHDLADRLEGVLSQHAGP